MLLFGWSVLRGTSSGVGLLEVQSEPSELCCVTNTSCYCSTTYNIPIDSNAKHNVRQTVGQALTKVLAVLGDQ